MAKDIYHENVKMALTKDDWLITHDPLFIQLGEVDVYVDLGAEKVIGAEKEGHKIAVEIKSFLRPSVISEFHTALGQYINYREALNLEQPDRTLYMAVPTDVYKDFFTRQFIQTVLTNQQIRLVVYDIQQEVITKWVD